MFKVICVKQFVNPADDRLNAPRPDVGDEDVVIREVKKEGRLYYVLERFGNDNGYMADNFAILPDTPEEVIAEPELAHA